MPPKITVGVIGAGAGGIAMGIQLADGGYDFTIFDRADGFGGTWRHNTFPGAACDVPSHLYSYSFALNPRWSKTYANQAEILAYLEQVAADRGLGAHLRPNTAITAVRWSDSRRRWTLGTGDGQEHEFDVVVSAVGMLDVPHIPDIPGAQRFRGRRFHSARWDHSKSTAGSGSRRSAPAPARFNTFPRLPQRQRVSPCFSAPRFGFRPASTSRSPPSSTRSSNATRRWRKSCATKPSMPTSHPASTSIRRRPARRRNWPAATSCARWPTPSCAQS